MFIRILIAAILTNGCTEPPPCKNSEEILSGAATLNVVVLGDTGKGDARQMQVAQAIGKVCGDVGCDFALLLGDNIYPSGVVGVDDRGWQTAFEIPYGTLNFPFYAVLGNHDYGARGEGYEFGRGAHQIAYSQINPKWRMPATCYDFAAGPAHFFAFDTMRMVWNQNNDAAAQERWFYAQPPPAKPWRIAFGHHSYRSNGPHGNAGEYDGRTWPPAQSGAAVRTFMQQTLCHSVDLYLSGHDHNRQILRGNDDCPMHLVVSGAGSGVYRLSGKNPTVF